MTTPRVAVVVLNWNGWRDSLLCLDSLRPSVAAGLARVIVVDNASSDGSLLEIRKKLRCGSLGFAELAECELTDGATCRAAANQEYVLLSANENRGYAAGNNLGIKLALQLAGIEFVFVLNNDTIVEGNCIAELLACAERHSTIGIFGSTLVEDGGRLRIAGGASYSVLLTRSRMAIAVGELRRGALDYVSGAAMFIRVTALEQVGLLSEEYFLFFEELDFTRRLDDAGYGIAWCPGSIVHHNRGQAAGSRSSKGGGKSSLAEYHSNLSCLVFTRKFHPYVFWFAVPLRFLLKLIHSAVYGQPELAVPLVRAYVDYFGERKRKSL